MKIKICGITSQEEIIYINKLKPDYIGFVFTASKRKITKKKAKDLARLLNKEVKVVGVFKDNSLIEIKNIISEVKLDVIQLHGDEDNEFIKTLRKIIKEEANEINNEVDKDEIKIWKGISIKTDEDLKRNLNLNVDNFILDGGNPGSGESFNWNLIETMAKKQDLFLAGGVNLNNIDEVIRDIKPYGIDVSSGVERVDELGNRKKDFYKIKKLIEKVRILI